jgi:hypothetical protein
MKAKNILMTILLVAGSIAAKAAGYPPELALVSQPVMVYNYDYVTVYYDVENIGDYTYRGYVQVYLSPDDGYVFAERYVRVRPGRIKRIAVDIPRYRIDPYYAYTIMPYYTLGNELYSFTTFEYFEPLTYHWHGTRSAVWIVTYAPPRPHYYHRPGVYRYYYDGYRPPMPPMGYNGNMPPPLNPMHHTYSYHHNNGGYPAANEGNMKPNNNEPAPTATVRPKANGNSNSMSSGSSNASTGNNAGTVNNGSMSNSRPTSSTRPKINDGTSTGRTPSSAAPSSGRTPSNSSSSRINNGSTSRPSGTTNSGRTGSSNTSSRVNNSSSNSRPSGTTSNTSRVGNSSSNTRSSGTSRGSASTRSSSSTSNSSNGSSSRTGSATGSGRR